MGLTPLDVHNQTFPKKALGGYDRDAVDSFLDQVIRDFEHYIKENDKLQRQVEDLHEKLAAYQSLEETIHRTLVVAQESAEEVKANAKKQADLHIQEARLQAERIIEAGHVKSRKILEENADLSRAAEVLRTQVRSILVAQLQAIEGMPESFLRVAAAQLPAERAANE
ncbi:MAG TPA: DivIVA domain-containing protein [Symbiobacteriaceae bacterium]|jgi:cell division initiation protein|nr:DivIVA domain-containing protein [Symbiobacteriaceae bacterium]